MTCPSCKLLAVFDRTDEEKAILRRGLTDGSTVRHTQVSKNFGVAGGWFYVETYTFLNGDPTGITKSHICHPTPQEELGIQL